MLLPGNPAIDDYPSGHHTQVVTTEMDDEDTIRQVVDKLAEKYPEMPRNEIQPVVENEFNGLSGRPVRDYLSILTERAAKKRIRKYLKREG